MYDKIYSMYTNEEVVLILPKKWESKTVLYKIITKITTLTSQIKQKIYNLYKRLTNSGELKVVFPQDDYGTIKEYFRRYNIREDWKRALDEDDDQAKLQKEANLIEYIRNIIEPRIVSWYLSESVFQKNLQYRMEIISTYYFSNTSEEDDGQEPQETSTAKSTLAMYLASYEDASGTPYKLWRDKMSITELNDIITGHYMKNIRPVDKKWKMSDHEKKNAKEYNRLMAKLSKSSFQEKEVIQSVREGQEATRSMMKKLLGK